MHSLRLPNPSLSPREFDNTTAIRDAIAAAHNAGGGRVVVPPGIFLTGAIHLRSNVNLHVSTGATLRFSTDPKHYLPLVRTRWNGMDLMNYSSLVHAGEIVQINVTVEPVGAKKPKTE